MAAEYQIRVRNQEGTPVGLLTTWRSLNLYSRVNEIGTILLTIGPDTEISDLFEIDGQIEVERSDPEQGLDWYIEWEGFHRWDTEGTFEAGSRNYIARGRSYEEMLRRRFIMYRPGTPYALKEGDGVSVAHSYVWENLGPGATKPPRLLKDGVWPGLSVVAPASLSGKTWDGDRAYKNVYHVVKEIADSCEFDFWIRNTGQLTWAYETFPRQRGRDLTTVGLVPSTGLNGAGNVPVVLSLDRGTVQRAALYQSHVQEANTIFVVGSGKVDDQKVVLVEDPAAQATSPFNQCEYVAHARDENDLTALQALGRTVLKENRATNTFSFLPMWTDALVWGRDMWLGDRVTIIHNGVVYHRRVVASDIRVAAESGSGGANGESISLEFDDVEPPVISTVTN